MVKKHLICGLDIGSSSIKGLVISPQTKKKSFDVLAFTEEPSLGVRKGVVVNTAQVSESLEKVLSRMEEQSNVHIVSAYVNVNGSHIFATPSKGLISVSRADHKISEEDIERVLEAAQTVSLPLNKEVLDIFPNEFIVDGERGIRDPHDLKGVRLEAEVLALIGFSPYINNLTAAVLNSGVEINDLVVSPLAAARAVLTQREKELGVALIELGAGNTGISIFEEGKLMHLSILPLGAANVTNDIAICLKTDIDIAEKIKLEFGFLGSRNNHDKKEKIKLSDGEILVFSRKQILRVIEDRMLEIFSEANKELKKAGKQQKLPAGIVLTGGGAKFPKIKDFAKRVFKLPCRLGKPKEIMLPREDIRFSGVCGLVLSGVDAENIRFEGGTETYGRKITEKIKKFLKIFIP